MAKTKRVKTPNGYRYMVNGKFASKAKYDRARGRSSSKSSKRNKRSKKTMTKRKMKPHLGILIPMAVLGADAARESYAGFRSNGIVGAAEGAVNGVTGAVTGYHLTGGTKGMQAEDPRVFWLSLLAGYALTKGVGAKLGVNKELGRGGSPVLL